MQDDKNTSQNEERYGNSNRDGHQGTEQQAFDTNDAADATQNDSAGFVSGRSNNTSRSSDTGSKSAVSGSDTDGQVG